MRVPEEIPLPWGKGGPTLCRRQAQPTDEFGVAPKATPCPGGAESSVAPEAGPAHGRIWRYAKGCTHRRSRGRMCADIVFRKCTGAWEYTCARAACAEAGAAQP
eukprot:15464924-Alexandrium_andersonii.AAC.1